MELPIDLLKCLEPLVGISRTECECYQELPPDLASTVNTSVTGMFLDEDEGFDPTPYFKTPGNCTDENSIWLKLIRMRRKAIADTIDSINVSLSSSYMSRTSKKVMIGEQSYSGYETLTAGRVIVPIKTKNLPGGLLRISHLGFGAKLPIGINTQNVQIRVRKQGELTDLYYYTWKIEMKENWMNRTPDTDVYPLPEPIELICNGDTYEIYYDYDPELFQPINNVLRCVFCPHLQNEVAHYFSELPTGKAYGLILNTEFTCDFQYLTCALTQNATLKRLIAGMILARTLAIFLTSKAVREASGSKQGNVLNSKQAMDLAAVYTAMFANKLNVITEQYYIQDTTMGCFTCRNGVYAKKGTIQLYDGYDDPEFENYPTMNVYKPHYE